MPTKSDKPEQIVAKLRQVNVLVSQGRSIADAMQEIGLDELTYYARSTTVPYIAPDFPIAYLHIPRTAGTSLSKMLAEHWRKVVLISTWEELSKFPKSQIEKALLVSGHFRAFQLEDPTFDRFRVLTVLRDPLARAISSYRYAYRRAVHDKDVDVKPNMRFASGHNFVEWFHSKYGSEGIAMPNFVFWASVLENDKDNCCFPNGLNGQRPASIGMLVGTFEQIELYTALLEKALALPKLSLPRVNTSEGVAVDKIEVSDSQLIAMRKLLEPDYVLYGYAQDRFNQLYQQYVGTDTRQTTSGVRLPRWRVLAELWAKVGDGMKG